MINLVVAFEYKFRICIIGLMSGIFCTLSQTFFLQNALANSRWELGTKSNSADLGKLAAKASYKTNARVM